MARFVINFRLNGAVLSKVLLRFMKSSSVYLKLFAWSCGLCDPIRLTQKMSYLSAYCQIICLNFCPGPIIMCFTTCDCMHLGHLWMLDRLASIYLYFKTHHSDRADNEIILLTMKLPPMRRPQYIWITNITYVYITSLTSTSVPSFVLFFPICLLFQCNLPLKKTIFILRSVSCPVFCRWKHFPNSFPKKQQEQLQNQRQKRR